MTFDIASRVANLDGILFYSQCPGCEAVARCKECIGLWPTFEADGPRSWESVWWFECPNCRVCAVMNTVNSGIDGDRSSGVTKECM